MPDELVCAFRVGVNTCTVEGFSARANARMRVRHSVWNTEVALTLSSCAKCMLIIGRCFHCGESSVITSPAVAIGLSRSGDSIISCS